MTASKVERGGVPIGSDRKSVATAGGGGTAGFTLDQS